MNSIAAFSKKTSSWKKPFTTTAPKVLFAPLCPPVTDWEAVKMQYCGDFGIPQAPIDKIKKIEYTL